MPDTVCSAAEYISDLLNRPQVRAVMEYLKEKDGETLSVQKELCAVCSPSNQEEARAELRAAGEKYAVYSKVSEQGLSGRGDLQAE